MSRQGRRLWARRARAIAGVCAAGVLALLAAAGPARAHEGHERDAGPRLMAPVAGSPRVVATSERYQLVGIVEGEVLVIYLDRADDNAPVGGAALEVSLDGAPFKAEP